MWMIVSGRNPSEMRAISHCPIAVAMQQNIARLRWEDPKFQPQYTAVFMDHYFRARDNESSGWLQELIGVLIVTPDSKFEIRKRQDGQKGV